VGVVLLALAVVMLVEAIRAVLTPQGPSGPLPYRVRGYAS
jgi:hypothetical protein